MNPNPELFLDRHLDQVADFSDRVVSRGDIEVPEIFWLASIARMYPLVASSILMIGRQMEGLLTVISQLRTPFLTWC
jgi:hypothetical protein